MYATFSRTLGLSLCVAAAFGIAGAIAYPTGSDRQSARKWHGGLYHGRPAHGSAVVMPRGAPSDVTVYYGGRSHPSRRAGAWPARAAGVNVFYGGGHYSHTSRMPDYVGGLDVVVTRGANGKDHPRVIVTRGMSLNGGVGYAPY